MNQETPEPEEASKADESSSGGAISHLVIGRIVATRGLRGELKVEIISDFPKRFSKLKRVYLGETLTPYDVERSRLHQDVALLKLREVDTSDEAAALKGKLVHVPVEEAVALEEGQYFWHEIIGLEVVTTTGERLGRVTDIIRTGANDVYVVHNGKETLIPVIEEVIKEIDPKGGRIVIEPMPGLIS